MRLGVIIFFLLLVEYSYGQEGLCGTKATTEQKAFMESIFNKQKGHARMQAEFLAEIPIKAHIIRKTDGTGGLTEPQLIAAIDVVNNFYTNASIQFFLDGAINYIDSDEFYDFVSSQEESLANSRDVSRVINVYFVNTLDNGSLCGYTRFPPSTDRVFLANSCVTGSNTFSHELGHYFTLWHTHGKTNTGTTDELVNGSNCETAGDDVCDTPADPNLSGKVASDCSYTGSGKDANGDLYAPSTSNIMSYSIPGCRDRLSPGQYARVRVGFEEGRNYLKYNVDDFRARFLADTREACVGNYVHFTSLTQSATSWFWEFSGGEPASSSQEKPVVRYDEPGVYQVKLTATTSSGVSDDEVKSAYIKIVDPVVGAIDFDLQIPFANELPQDWEIGNIDQSLTFTYSPIGYNNDGTGSLYLDIRDYATETPNNTDRFETPFISNLGVKKYTISFDYAYTYFKGGVVDGSFEDDRYDSLKIGINYSCSDSEPNFVWSAGGESLATVVPNTNNEAFVPSGNSEWKHTTIEVPLDGTKDFLRIALVVVSNNGNNIYIDNLHIIPDTSLETPTFFRRSTTADDYYTFRWADNAVNELNYIIERSEEDASFVPLDSLPPNTTLFVDQTAHDGNIYQYRLYALGRNNEKSAYTDIVEVANNITSTSIDSDNLMVMWPNPVSSDVVYLKLNGVSVAKVELLDISGKAISLVKFTNPSDEIAFDLAGVPGGLYLMRIETPNTTKVFKLIKNEN